VWYPKAGVVDHLSRNWPFVMRCLAAYVGWVLPVYSDFKGAPDRTVELSNVVYRSHQVAHHERPDGAQPNLRKTHNM
jgi:hypothetical protein